jgi:acetoin:2,6-dichlorophenolindophenol oxidoreductase subunit alpha
MNKSSTSSIQARGLQNPTPEETAALYRRMLLIRRSEEAIVRLYPENDMKTPMHMSMGQEAIPSAVCEALGNRGEVIASYRSHATYLAQTLDVNRFFGELYGRVTGTADGKSGSMHLADIERGHLVSSGVVGAGISVAVGAAFANGVLKNNKIVAVFFGDGALEEGVFWESLNVASLKRVRVLFVCEDNGYAVHSGKPVRHAFQSLDSIVKGFASGYFSDTSNDVESIYATTKEAIKHLDSEHRPAFLHYRCYRYLEHVGIGSDLDYGYRSREEWEGWMQRDSLRIQRERLIDLGLEKLVGSIESDVDSAVASAIDAAQRAELPAPDRLFRGVFHEGA